MSDDLKPRTTSILGLTVQLSGTVRVSHPADWTREQVKAAVRWFQADLSRRLREYDRETDLVALSIERPPGGDGAIFSLDWTDDADCGTFDPPEDDDDLDDAEIEDELFGDDDSGEDGGL